MTVLSVENIRVNIKVKKRTIWITTNMETPSIVEDRSIWRYGRYDGLDVFVIHNQNGKLVFEIRRSESEHISKEDFKVRSTVLKYAIEGLREYLCYVFVYRIHYHRALLWTEARKRSKLQKHFDEGLEKPTPLDYIHQKFPERLEELRALEKSLRDLLTSIDRLCKKLKGKT